MDEVRAALKAADTAGGQGRIDGHALREQECDCQTLPAWRALSSALLACLVCERMIQRPAIYPASGPGVDLSEPKCRWHHRSNGPPSVSRMAVRMTATAAVRQAARPHKMPKNAVIQMVAAVVSPCTSLLPLRCRMTPAPRKPMPTMTP